MDKFLEKTTLVFPKALNNTGSTFLNIQNSFVDFFKNSIMESTAQNTTALSVSNPFNEALNVAELIDKESEIQDKASSQGWNSLVNFYNCSVLEDKSNPQECSGKNGKIVDTKQGQTGDCWVLSAINSLSYTQKGKEIIKNALEYKNNETIVHFVTGDVVVDNEAFEKAKSEGDYSSGDDDMLIFELAMEQVVDDVKAGKINIPNGVDIPSGDDITDGGTNDFMYYVLTGETSEQVGTSTDKIRDVFEYYIENNNKDFVLSANTALKANRTIKDVNGNDVKIYGSHGYSIKRASNDSVTIINPHDSSREITISRDDFDSAFTSVVYCDISGADKFDNWFCDKDKNREVINGVQYECSVIRDKQGNITFKRMQVYDGICGIEFDYKGDKPTIRLYDIDKNGNIALKNDTFTEEQAQKILDRKLLTLGEEYTIGCGLANDIICSKVADLSDERWNAVDCLLMEINCDPSRIDLQILGKLATLDTLETIDRAVNMIIMNKTISPNAVYSYLSGQWSQDEFDKYLKDNNIELKE